MTMFYIPVEPPPTHQAALRILKNKATGKMFVGKMEKSSAKKWCNEATRLMVDAKRQNCPDAAPLDEPIQVGIVLIYPHTKESKKIADKTGEDVVVKSTRPDLDNLSKSVLDCLVNSGWIKDDGLIVELILRKGHGESPMVIVDITPYNK
jgi:Holliday junction resolvase RusA-like endonuclease